jgi:hypothetical protein
MTSPTIHMSYTLADLSFMNGLSRELSKRGYSISTTPSIKELRHKEDTFFVFVLSFYTLQSASIQENIKDLNDWLKSTEHAGRVTLITLDSTTMPTEFTGLSSISATNRSVEEVAADISHWIDTLLISELMFEIADRASQSIPDDIVDKPEQKADERVRGITFGEGKSVTEEEKSPKREESPVPLVESQDQYKGLPPNSPAPASEFDTPIQKEVFPSQQPPPPYGGSAPSSPLPYPYEPLLSPGSVYPQTASAGKSRERSIEIPKPHKRQISGKEKSLSVPTSTLQFSSYYPQTITVSNWHTLLVYSYIAEMLAQIQADAATFTELGSNPNVSTGTATRAVTEGVELLVEPHLEGVEFSPKQESFIWRGNWHRSLFRFYGDSSLAGKTVTGWIDIYAGANPMVPIARIDISFPFRSNNTDSGIVVPKGIIVTSNIHDTVFISYSHRDKEAFNQVCETYRKFGININADEKLESGADYEQDLSKMIDESQIFHLLWSEHSSTSSECKKEWIHALEREPSERFVKPWYWKQPIVPPPSEFIAYHISFRYQRLKRKWWLPQTWF